MTVSAGIIIFISVLLTNFSDGRQSNRNFNHDSNTGGSGQLGRSLVWERILEEEVAQATDDDGQRSNRTIQDRLLEKALTSFI